MTDSTILWITLSVAFIVVACLIVAGTSSCFLIVRWRTCCRSWHLRCIATSFAVAMAAICSQQVIYHFIFWPAVVERSNISTLLKIGDIVPAYDLKTLSGKTIILGPEQKELVILDFFATWCAPCCAELPHIQKFTDIHNKNTDFQLVIVGREQSEEVLAEFRDKHGYTMDFASDPERELFNMYATAYIPRTVVIGIGGEILLDWTGFTPDYAEAVESVILDHQKSHPPK